MRVAPRPAAVGCLTALALTFVTLTGCSGDNGDGDGRSSATTPASSPTPSASSPAAEAPSPSTPASPWAGTKQFVQIDSARTDDGATYLSVRTAQKKPHEQFEAWVIVPGEGPYTEVRMADDAQVLLSVPLGDAKHPASYSQTDFVTRLTAQPSSARPNLGYDLSFDAEGRVTRLQSLYTP